ncbi:unnamed protein product [Lactuca saligna]|uniref:Uncharacterized protein n=1 Tax=Lactuca saligna TaxID=75948 RepID=A0AA35Y2X2_LACSI|nr:unnamed protein product [Lactuca saligna]
MREIRTMSTEAYEHLVERDPNTWYRAFFEAESCCDAMENNISESFNAAIVEARKKPIITMLEEIKLYEMERMYNQKLKGHKWDMEICPSIRKRIEKMKEQQRAWQLSGIHCVHAIVAILYLNGNVEDSIVVWFKTSMVGSCYRYPVKPINGANMWLDVLFDPILPPRRRRMPGRPKVNRRKCSTENEGRHTINKTGISISRCSNCHQKGHNKSFNNATNKETVSEEPVGEEGDVEEGVGDDGVGEERAVEEGDIEDHQKDEIDHQEVVVEVVQDEVDHHEAVVEVAYYKHVFDEVDHHQHQLVFFFSILVPTKGNCLLRGSRN